MLSQGNLIGLFMTSTVKRQYRRVYLHDGEAEEAWEIVGETASRSWLVDEFNPGKSVSQNRKHREQAMKIAGSALAALREVLDFISEDDARALLDYAIRQKVSKAEVQRVEAYTIRQ